MLPADADLRSWNDVSLLRPLYAVVAFSAVSILGERSTSPRGHGNGTLTMFTEVCVFAYSLNGANLPATIVQTICNDSGLWTEPRLLVERDLWKLIAKLAINGHGVYKTTMDENIDRWLALDIDKHEVEDDLEEGDEEPGNGSFVRFGGGSEGGLGIHEVNNAMRVSDTLRNLVCTTPSGDNLNTRVFTSSEHTSDPVQWFEGVLRASADRTSTPGSTEATSESTGALLKRNRKRLKVTLDTNVDDASPGVRRSERKQSNASDARPVSYKESKRFSSGKRKSKRVEMSRGSTLTGAKSPSEDDVVYVGTKRKTMVYELDEEEIELLGHYTANVSVNHCRPKDVSCQNSGTSNASDMSTEAICAPCTLPNAYLWTSYVSDMSAETNRSSCGGLV